MFKKAVTFLGILTLAGSPLLADFTYQETSTITGGMMASMMRLAGVFSKQAREPIQSTVAVKGDRMMHRSANHASIIDLGSQTITSIDMQKKQYSVMTFDEMKQMLDQMSQKMKQNDKGEMQFKVSANNTGKTQQVAGFEAREMVLKMELEGTDKQSGQTGSMVITTDMWIAPVVPGYSEVRDFYKRMAEKLNWAPGGNMFMANPQVSQGMAEVYKEIAKLDGMPVLQYVTMGAEGTAPAGGEQPQAAAPPPQQQSKPSVGDALGSALGGRFGLGRKKQAPPQDQPPAENTGSAGSGSLLEMKTEMSGFSSSAVDVGQFSVPAAFKKVEPDKRLAR